MKRLVLVVTLVSASTNVFAQEETEELTRQPPPPIDELRAPPEEAPPEQPPPAELPPILAPPVVYAPVHAVPVTVVEQIDALEQQGRHHKTVGAVLQTMGGILAFTGAALLVASSWSDDGSCIHNDSNNWAVQSYTTPGPSTGSRTTVGPPSCGDGNLAFAGGMTLLLGVAVILPGVAISQSGVTELQQARQLRRRHGIEWSLRPSFSTQTAKAELSLRF
jgi:hypothetical protein